MAAASAITSRRGNDQFRGIYSDTWAITCTLDSASVATGGAGVALGDMVISISAGVSEAGIVRRAYISAANVVTIATTNTTGGAVDLAATTVRLVIGRMV